MMEKRRKRVFLAGGILSLVLAIFQMILIIWVNEKIGIMMSAITQTTLLFSFLLYQQMKGWKMWIVFCVMVVLLTWAVFEGLSLLSNFFYIIFLAFSLLLKWKERKREFLLRQTKLLNYYFPIETKRFEESSWND